MSNNVDISEVVDFSNDLQEASSDMKASLDAVQEQIEKINGMDSFSGKAAKEAKTYFGDFHLTILESFRGLFDALGENLQQHIDTFESDVDGGDAVIIKSKDLEEIKEDMQELFEKLQEQDEDIHDTIDDVTDISSATPPSFSDIDEWKRKATKKLKELDEDLASFTGESDETDVNAIMEEIKGAMSHAKTREGKARFANFEGASKQDELAKLKAFNEDKKKATEEKIENLDDQSKAYLKQAQSDYNNQKIDKATYESIRSEIIQDGLFFIQNAKENNLSRNVSEQVQQDVSEWANKAYDINHMVASSKEHQAIGPYHAMKNPDLLFPLTYRHRHAAIKKAKSADKNKEETTQNLAGQGNVTADEEMAIRNYLDQLDENDTDMGEVIGKDKVNNKSSSGNQISEANKEALEIQKEKETENRASEDVNRAREPLTVWDQKEVVSRDSDLAGDTDTLGHFATAGLNFAFDDIGTIIDPDATEEEKMLASAFLFGKPLKVGDKVYDAYKAAHKTNKAEKKTNKLKTFKSDESIKHFEKHGNEIKDALGKNQYNLKNYLHDANHVIQNGQHVPELNGYVKLIGGKGKAKYGFVGVDRNTGDITTFHIKNVKELSKKAPSLGID